MKTISTLLLAVALLVVGCSDDTTTNTLVMFDPEIVNEPDAFQFQVTDAENVSTTVAYTWSNTGSRATIDHSSAVDAGTATLTLLDADGTMVYTSDLQASGNESSTEGTPGSWTVRIVFDRTSGTLNFRAEKL